MKYISHGKNLKIKAVDSSIKDKCIAYCPELTFGIISPYIYLDIGKMNIISSDTKIINKLSVIPEEITLPSFLK